MALTPKARFCWLRVPLCVTTDSRFFIRVNVRKQQQPLSTYCRLYCSSTMTMLLQPIQLKGTRYYNHKAPLELGFAAEIVPFFTHRRLYCSIISTDLKVVLELGFAAEWYLGVLERVDYVVHLHSVYNAPHGIRYHIRAHPKDQHANINPCWVLTVRIKRFTPLACLAPQSRHLDKTLGVSIGNFRSWKWVNGACSRT